MTTGGTALEQSPEAETALQRKIASLGSLLAPLRKLRPPVRAAGLVSREPLIARQSRSTPTVAVIAAPGGYGKTTLAAEWAATDERPVAWLTVDATDNDPAALLTLLALAMDAVEPVDPEVVSGLWGQRPPMATSVLPRFGRMLAARQVPFVLVVDDLHLLIEVEAIDAIAVIVAEMPPGSLVILAGRSRPALRLARLRASGELVEVGMRELALTVPEAAEFMASTGLEVDTERVQELVERTEGWPAGLYLAAVSLRDHGDVEAAIASIAGDDRHVADYLRDEWIDGLDPAVATFVLGASCLDQLSAPLCDAVLRRKGSGELLESLERQNLLVIPLDRTGDWFRFHHLLAELLQDELLRREPREAVRIHAGASAWYEASGDTNRAVHHAFRAGDVARVEALIHANFGAYAAHGRHDTIGQWLALFTSEQLATKPMLTIIAAYSRLAVGDGPGASHWLSRAEQSVTDRYSADARGWTPPVALAILRATVAPLTAQEMADEARFAHDHMPLGDWHSMCCLLRGAAEFMLDNDVLADELLEEGAAAAAVDAPNVEALCLAHLAVLRLEQGSWDQAIALGRRSRTVVAEHGLEHVPNLFLAYAVSALVEAQAGRVPEAHADRHVARHQLTGYLHQIGWGNLQARIALARADLLLGDRIAARTRLAEAEWFLDRAPDAVRVKEQVADVQLSLSRTVQGESGGPSSLTTAETRVLEFLPTHLTLAEIADRLFVSRNTVKTQAIAVYRKLGTSSRGGAVKVARESGLLDDSF